MAVTAIQAEKNGKIVRMKFMTVQTEDHLDVDVFSCNEEFIPIGEPAMGLDPREEEEYHRQLRTGAILHGQFIPNESTHPEWTPGYVELPEEDNESL